MQKQLSKKSHKVTESSVEDFMKHIKRYNLQSERYISPKPLLYMYTNPSRNFTLQTLQKSRSKSKTLSNRQSNKQMSQCKKNTSKNILVKVEKMLSLNKNHRKSISLISYNDKSHKKSNKSIIDLCESTTKIKQKSKLIDKIKQSKISKEHKKSKQNKQFKQTFIKTNKKHTKSKTKFDTKYTENSPFQYQQSSAIQVNTENPAQLIQSYSKKLSNVQKYLEEKNKLGSVLCKKFKQILNQIISSLVHNLKKSLNELQTDIQKRLQKQFNFRLETEEKQFNKKMAYMQKICQKLANKVLELLKKQNYSNNLIYNLRKQGIDIDKEFGKAVWNNQNLGGRGYNKQNSQNGQQTNSKLKIQKTTKIQQIEKSSYSSLQHYQDEFEFCEHPNVRLKREMTYIKNQSKEQDQFEQKKSKIKLLTHLQYIEREEQLPIDQQIDSVYFHQKNSL